VNQEKLELGSGHNFSLTGSDDQSATGKLVLDSTTVLPLKKEFLKSHRGKQVSTDTLLNYIMGKAREDMDKISGGFDREVINLNVSLEGKFEIWDQDLALNLNWDWFPEVPTIDFSDLDHLTKPIVENFTDEELLKHRELILGQHKVLLESQGAIAKGDIVELSWAVKVDSEEEWEEVEGAKTTIQIGVKPRLQLDLEEKLIGAKAGDVIEHELDIPRSPIYPQFSAYKKEISKLFGKKIQVRITVHSVKAWVMPEMNEELLKKLGLKSMDDFQERATESLRRSVEDKSKSVLKVMVLDYLRSKEFEVPSHQVKGYTEFILQHLASKLNLHVDGTSHEDWTDEYKQAYMGQLAEQMPEIAEKHGSFDSLLESTSKAARKMVCGDFIISVLPKQMELKEQEINDKVFQIMYNLGLLNKRNRGEIDRYMQELRTSIILDHVMSKLEEDKKIKSEHVTSVVELDEKAQSILSDEYVRYLKLCS